MSDVWANYLTSSTTATVLKRVKHGKGWVCFEAAKPATMVVMRVMGRRLGWLLVIGAFVLAATENAARGLSGDTGVLGILSAEKVLEVLAPDVFAALAYYVSEYTHPLFWDPLLLWLLVFPSWLITGVPGAILVWKCRKIPLGGEPKKEDLAYTSYEDVLAAAKEADFDNPGESSKYKDLDEYDPLHPPYDGVNYDGNFAQPPGASDLANFRKSDWIASLERQASGVHENYLKNLAVDAETTTDEGIKKNLGTELPKPRVSPLPEAGGTPRNPTEEVPD